MVCGARANICTAVTLTVGASSVVVFAVAILAKYRWVEAVANESVKFCRKLLVRGTRKFPDATSLRAYVARCTSEACMNILRLTCA